VGHFLPREMPNVVTEHMLRHFRAQTAALS